MIKLTFGSLVVSPILYWNGQIIRLVNSYPLPFTSENEVLELIKPCILTIKASLLYFLSFTKSNWTFWVTPHFLLLTSSVRLITSAPSPIFSILVFALDSWIGDAKGAISPTDKVAANIFFLNISFTFFLYKFLIQIYSRLFHLFIKLTVH